MYIVGDKEFHDINDAISFAIKQKNVVLYVKDTTGLEIQKEVIYSKCNCDNKCPKTCIHKEYEARRTVCYYQWTCSCNCDCPNETNCYYCVCCNNELCSECYMSVNNKYGFCKVCISNNFKYPSEEGYQLTTKEYIFLKDIPDENRDKSIFEIMEEHPEIFYNDIK